MEDIHCTKVQMDTKSSNSGLAVVERGMLYAY